MTQSAEGVPMGMAEIEMATATRVLADARRRVREAASVFGRADRDLEHRLARALRRVRHLETVSAAA